MFGILKQSQRNQQKIIDSNFLKFGSVNPTKDASTVQNMLSPEEKEKVQKQLQEYEATLSISPEDAVAREVSQIILCRILHQFHCYYISSPLKSLQRMCVIPTRSMHKIMQKPGNRCALLNTYEIQSSLCDNDMTRVIDYLLNVITIQEKDKMFFLAPYYEENHWVLFIISPRNGLHIRFTYGGKRHNECT